MNWGTNQPTVGELESRLECHALWKASKGHFHSVGEVMLWKREFVVSSKMEETIKAQILSALGEVQDVLALVYQTSDVKVEPLSGHGLMYIFYFHPTTHALVGEDVGNWRS